MWALFFAKPFLNRQSEDKLNVFTDPKAKRFLWERKHIEKGRPCLALLTASDFELVEEQ